MRPSVPRAPCDVRDVDLRKEGTMDQNLLVFILSVVVFVLGAVFINFTVKREDAARKVEESKTKASAKAETVKKAA